MIPLSIINNKQYASINDLHLWDKNPKVSSDESKQRLNKQLDLGQHSPLLIIEDGTVIGGNQRLPEMKARGYVNVHVVVLSWVKDEEKGYYPVLDGATVLDPATSQVMRYFKTPEDMMLAYALSHNERTGRYDLELLKAFDTEIELDDFSIELDEPTTFEDINVEFESAPLTDQERLDKKKEVTCPECGCVFSD